MTTSQTIKHENCGAVPTAAANFLGSPTDRITAYLSLCSERGYFPTIRQLAFEYPSLFPFHTREAA